MSIFRISKSGTERMIKDPNDPSGIRYILDDKEQHSVFTVQIDKAYHFRNHVDEPGIDEAARLYILEDLKLQIETELEAIKNGKSDRHRCDGTSFDR